MMLFNLHTWKGNSLEEAKHPQDTMISDTFTPWTQSICPKYPLPFIKSVVDPLDKAQTPHPLDIR